MSLLGVAFQVACFASRTADEPRVRLPIYTYNDFPPFQDSDEPTRGLSRLWTDEINTHLETFSLDLLLVERTELDRRLAAGEELFVLWAKRDFFPRYDRFAESDVVLVDSNVLVSREAFEIDRIDQLPGRRFCVLPGWSYPELASMIGRGELILVEASSPAACLETVRAGRADFLWIMKSYFLSIGEDRRAGLRMTDWAIDVVDRHVLATPGLADRLTELDRAIRSLKTSVRWRDELAERRSREFLDLLDLRIDQILEVPLPAD